MSQMFLRKPKEPEEDFFVALSKGNISEQESIHKFGKNVNVGMTYSAVSPSAVYQTPQVSSATALRIKAGDANDTAAGSGAQEIILQGLDLTGREVTELLATAGASPSALTSTLWLRLYRFKVTKSGTYATDISGSHAADIVVETAGGVEWGRIDSGTIPNGQSQVAAYTTRIGLHAGLADYKITIDSGKPVDFIFGVRENILQTAAPYSAFRVVHEMLGIEGASPPLKPFTPLGPYPPLTDLIWLAKGQQTPQVTIDFELVAYS